MRCGGKRRLAARLAVASPGKVLSTIVVVAAVAAVATACGGVGPIGASSPPPSIPATASDGTSTSGSAATATGSGAAGPAPECTAADLSVTGGATGAGLGHSALVLLFTNSSSAPCFVQGYPGVALQLSGGGVYNAERTMTGYMGGDAAPSPTRVSLAPGATASAVIEWLDAPQDGGAVTTADCTGYAAVGLLVTAPDQTSSTELGAPGALPVCWGFEVHPIVPGSGGRYPAAS